MKIAPVGTDRSDQKLAPTHTGRAQTLHVSPLFRAIKKASGTQDPLSCLKQLAVERGCMHYEGTFDPPAENSVGMQMFTNEQLVVALCLPHFGTQPNNIRMAAELASLEGVSAKNLAFLAEKERCVREIAYIAGCGERVEPQNQFWKQLLTALPNEKKKLPVARMPHWTRFAILAGRDRSGKTTTHWLRPRLILK